MDDRHVKVLLIEDNPGDARLIRGMLADARRATFDLEWADRLSKGVERLARGAIDVVLLDLGLPDSQGIDTFVSLQAQAPGVPIILLTGLDDEALAVKVVQEGAKDYLVKGQVDSHLLVRSIRHAIGRHRGLAQQLLKTERQQVLERPLSIEETGLTMSLLGELALKLIHNAGEIGAGEISRQLRLPFVNVVESILEMLKRQQLINIIGTAGLGERGYRYTVSGKGIERVHQALERNQYVGPAPVPLERYNAMVRAQAVDEVLFDEAAVAAAFEGLVVNQAILDKIGPAVNSGKSIFLYGPPGDGKTTAATRMARLLAREPIYIPYAVSVDSHIIRVYDELNHSPVEGEPSPREGGKEIGLGQTVLDERWVLVERPVVMVGGELTLESLNLIWDPAVKYYEAPFQMKANGGMFLIDDFGRQQIDPQDLLNRWMVPLETRVDFLTLHTGKKIEIPFEQLVVFATNLNPADLVDDAFLRRIRHKIKVDNPTAEEFHQVFQNACGVRGVEYTRKGFMHLVREWYVTPQRDFRNCHPRDIVDQLLDIARYKRLRPLATPEMIDRACSTYFADL